MGLVAHNGYDAGWDDVSQGSFTLYDSERHDPLMKLIGTKLPFDPVPYEDEWVCKRCGHRRVFRAGMHRSRGGLTPFPLEKDGDYVCGATTQVRTIEVPQKKQHWGGIKHQAGEPLVERVLGPLDDHGRHSYNEKYMKDIWLKTYKDDPNPPSWAWESRQVVPEPSAATEGTCPNTSIDNWEWPRLAEAWRQHAWLKFMGQWNAYVSSGGRGLDDVWVEGEDVPREWLPSDAEVAAVLMHRRLSRLEGQINALRQEIMDKLAGSHIVYP
jgi:hypothetical protein